MAVRKPQGGAAAGETALNPIEVRLSGGMLALVRFLMTLQNKRMPVARFTVGRDRKCLRVTILLDCAPEQARRYLTLLSALEDVEEIEEPEETTEVALLKTSGTDLAAPPMGVGIHKEGDTVVASGEPVVLEAWLTDIREDLEDVVRLGPVARPENGGS